MGYLLGEATTWEDYVACRLLSTTPLWSEELSQEEVNVTPSPSSIMMMDRKSHVPENPAGGQASEAGPNKQIRQAPA